MNRNAFTLMIALMALVMAACDPEEKPAVSVIPKPLSLTQATGSLQLGRDLMIAANPGFAAEAAILAGQLEGSYGLSTEIVTGDKPSEADIYLMADPGIENKEAYRLESGKTGITLSAGHAHGIFNGIQTLLQLITQPEAPLLPFVEIEDEPRFAWRGLMMDVSRHFFEIEFLKKLLNAMAMHKMNVLHLHLTEDQGWRIEIPEYPELTEISAWRDETLTGHLRDIPHTFDGKKHGGYYTREEIRDLVEYAEKLHITIVPEIEMPGHAEAAIAAFPELSCLNSSNGVSRIWGVHENVYCAGKESTFEFLENVLSSTLDLFPSEYFHIGGDECPKKHWENCPLCQKRIREEGLKDEHELQSYFIQRMERFLNENGKKLIGWDEILEGGLAENAAVMSWRGEKGGIAAANQEHYVVMTPTESCYFDYYQADPETEPLAIGSLLTMQDVYSYDPVPEQIDPEKQKYIMGVQANVWTEYISTPEHAEYMIFPRACAMSEVQWTHPDNKDYTDFLRRMETHFKRLSAKNINFRAPVNATETLQE